MGKIVIESHYSRFKPVGQDEKCATCPSGCKTSCVRRTANKADTEQPNTIGPQKARSRKTSS